MPLLSIVVALVVIGVVMYVINRYIPMASGIKNLLNVVVVILAAVWVLQVLGLWGRVTSYKFLH
jgi:predicted membrane protein